MPLYEYQCTECGHRTEQIQRLSDPPLASCPECGGRVRKLFSAPAVQFKGSGWYVTDYAGKGKQAAGDQPPAKAKDGDGKPAKEASGEGKPAKESSDGGKKTSPAKDS